MNDKKISWKKTVAIVFTLIGLFLFGVFAGRTGNNDDIKNRLDAVLNDNARITAELETARDRVAELESGIDAIGDTAGRIGEINAGLESRINHLGESIQSSARASGAITDQHRKSGELIGELTEIIGRYSAGFEPDNP